MIENKSDIDFSEFSEFILNCYSQCLEELSVYGDVLFSLDEPWLNQNVSFYSSLEYKSFLSSTKAEIFIHCCDKIEIESCRGFVDSLHLDHSLHAGEPDLPYSFVGLDSLSTDLPEFSGTFEKKKNIVKYISPSCGLAFKTNQELTDICDFFKRI